jgi:DNA-binding NtrC family response regulator
MAPKGSDSAARRGRFPTTQRGNTATRARKIADVPILCPGAAEVVHYNGLTTTSQPMLALIHQLQLLEQSLATVLIEGESGTGKELVARALHERSRVAKGPFIAINCGVLDRALIRSELFGHKKGAFTGAINEHIGAIEAACGGTLFLDEIGELPYEIQPFLLRALETRTVCRVGDTVERRVNARVLAATNRNLALEVGAKHFRDDLYFRLSVVRVQVPTLAQRSKDIELLAQHFAAQLGLPPLPKGILHEVRSRPWRGNVRELKNSIQFYAIFGSIPPTLPYLTSSSRRGCEHPTSHHETADNDMPDIKYAIDISRTYSEEKTRMTRLLQSAYFRRVLALTKGNKSKAARIAGVERSYFSKVLRRLDAD